MTLDFNSRLTKADRFVDLIDAAMKPREEAPREYLGASAIGETCARRLQYEFQGAPKDEGSEFSPKTLRIFHRGHIGEDWMAEWIRKAGFDLRTEKNGKQFGFEDCNGRFKGHIDGVIVGGDPAFKYPALWENKVLGAKGWGQLQKHGVAKAYPKYAAQVAVYQAYMQLAENPAIFTALNADTMEIHVALIPFDQELAQTSIDRAAQVIAASEAGEILPRGAESEESFLCRFCPFKEVCWA